VSNNQTSSVKNIVYAGVLTILSITTVLIVAGAWLGNQMGNQLRWTDHTHQVRQLLASIEGELVRAESAQRAFLLTSKEEFLSGYEPANDVGKQIDNLQQLVADNGDQVSRCTALREQVDQKLAFMSRCIALKRAGQPGELKNYVDAGEGPEKSQAIHRTVAAMDGVESSLLETRRSNLSRTQSGLNWTLLVGLCVDLIVGLTVLSVLAQRLAPLTPAADFAERIGKGDLTSDALPVRINDEVGRVSSSLNQMLNNLRAAAHQNQNHADILNNATAKLASASREQAVALQQQSTAMQETSVTLEELGQSASQIADRAREVASRAEATSQAAGVGLDSVRKSVRSTQSLVDQVQVVSERINALAEKTDAIRSIVLSVNDIAERSNVLALNAAILAAAAGSEGKSFTVVANEMKSLADQCKEATVQVRDLLGEVERGIQASVVLIEEAGKRGLSGSTFTDEASVSIHQLNSQVHDSTQAFQQIVAATNQQRLAFEQVAEALLSIRQATSQSATSTQQLEQTTRELHRLSGELVKSLDNYKMDRSG
jgi:methyl-accepting chemotaxis protein